MTGENIVSPAQARALTDRIKVGVEAVWTLVEQAYVERAWAVLGYASWDDYCTREFGTSRLRLPREERQEVVASMRETGMSTRAIASAIGVDAKTIRTDLADRADVDAGGDFSPPAAPAELDNTDVPEPPAAAPPLAPIVTGTDGKTYAAQRSPGEQSKPKRRPLPAALTDATRDLLRDAERLDRLAQDDRFTRNRKETHHQLPDVIAALGHTVELVRAMNPADTTANEEARRWWATTLRNLADVLNDVADSIEWEK